MEGEIASPTRGNAELVGERARSRGKRGFEGARRRAQYDASRENASGAAKKKQTHRVFGWPEPCCALVETRERDTVVGYECAKQTTPACDGGYDACQGARDAAFFAASAKIE